MKSAMAKIRFCTNNGNINGRWYIKIYSLLVFLTIAIYTIIIIGRGTVYANIGTQKKVVESHQLSLDMKLEYIYEHYNGTRQFDHWKEYAPHYEVHLNLLMRRLDMEQEFRILEIGVRFGGSMEVWKRYFSKMNLYYTGLDIEQRCKRFEDKSRNVFIEIGSQTSKKDLIKICKEHGPFHLIVDDGGHGFDQMKTSIDTLFPSDLCMTRDSLYVIEDMHTMKKKDSNWALISSIPSEIFRRMHYYWYHWPHWKRALEQNQLLTPNNSDKKWADSIESISLYDSMMFVHRGTGSGPLTEILSGLDGW